METFGFGTYGQEGLIIKKWGSKNSNLIVGNYVSLASNIKIYLGGNHPMFITTFPFSELYNAFDKYDAGPESKGDVIIGHDSWICENVIILSGTHIADGCIISNGSVISGKTKPYGVYGGNPATLLYFRYSKDRIEKLLKLKWWFWDLKRIEDNMHLLLSKNIDEFIEKNLK